MWKAKQAAVQWHNHWTRQKRLQSLVYEEDLYPIARRAARSLLERKPFEDDVERYCFYYQTLNNTIGIWENWTIEKIFSRLPYNHIGEIARHNPGSLYACALEAEWFDSRYTRGHNGDVKIVFCLYRIDDKTHCHPDERRYDPDNYAPIPIDFYKMWW